MIFNLLKTHHIETSKYSELDSLGSRRELTAAKNQVVCYCNWHWWSWDTAQNTKYT